MTKAEIENYLSRFCDKHEFDIEDSNWIADEVGTVVNIADFFFVFEDIQYDLDTNQPEGKILEWYDITLELYMEHKDGDTPPVSYKKLD